jgi:hypothetical protein
MTIPKETKKWIRKLEKVASELENQNYHSEAGFYFDLIKVLETGTIDTYGGEAILAFIEEYNW